MRIDAALAAARLRLAEAAQDAAAAADAREEAAVLMCAVLTCTRAWLFAHADEVLDTAAAARFHTLLERRLAGEPVAYLLGHREFWSLPLTVTAETLIPRPDTERLVEAALVRLPVDHRRDVVDLGTGSGAIALALARERPLAWIVAIDRSEGALRVARENAERLQLLRIEWLCGSWLEPLAERSFDVIAGNPPYIARNDPHLLRGDLRFEPLTALASGEDGLDDLRFICANAPRHLKPGGWLLLEHGFDQAAAVRGLMRDAGLLQVASLYDYGGNERVTEGRAPG
jgi:release factor glutamine methyltransferase